MTHKFMPTLRGEDSSLSAYLKKTYNIPNLTPEEEADLLGKVRDGDHFAKNKIVQSHLKLVAKVANGYRGYGLPIADLIAEGNIGILQAIAKYDMSFNFRFAHYAVWWVKAFINRYVIKSWSMINVANNNNQRKLFFKMSKVKNLETNEDVVQLAKDLNVPESEVNDMRIRLQSPDLSLNSLAGGGDSSSEWVDWIADESPDPELTLLQKDELDKRQKMLTDALKCLSQREYHIIKARRLLDKPLTLDVLSKELKISRERVRQIELKAFEKLQNHIRMLVLEERHRCTLRLS